ncbi:MAG: c-type cytochrome [Planctomycetota bacterium]
MDSSRREMAMLHLVAHYFRVSTVALVLAVALPALGSTRALGAEPVRLTEQAAFRGPVDLVVNESETWAVTVNRESGTISLVSLGDGRVLDEVAVGRMPSGLSLCANGDVLVSCQYSGELVRFAVAESRLEKTGELYLGMEPLGIATTQEHAFVCLQVSDEIAKVDLESFEIVSKLKTGRWPRYLDVTPDGSRLAVGLCGESHIAVLDANDGSTLYEEPLSGGINIGHLEIADSGAEVYFPWMIYRPNPITVRDIQRGWVLASRLARIRMDGPKYREAISLDVPRLAVADPFGVAMTPNGKRIAVTSSGTHELLVYRLEDLPFQGTGGPGDLIDPALMRDDDLFFRMELSGRPMGMQASSDGRRVYIANHLLDVIQIADLESREVVAEVSLGDVPQDAKSVELHRGMEIFYDAEKSLDQWYSCHSCHVDGGTNAKAMDTWNDGSELTSKTVLPLYGVTETGPWTWHGWQNDLDASLQNSFVSTMKGDEVSSSEIAALREYLGSLELPPNPFAELASRDEDYDALVSAGKELFESEAVGCANCHSGDRKTDGEIHVVGLERDTDRYEGYNTPSLRGVYRKPRLLHDGRAKSLQSVLKKWHRDDEIGGGAELSEKQIEQLIAYLKTL